MVNYNNLRDKFPSKNFEVGESSRRGQDDDEVHEDQDYGVYDFSESSFTRNLTLSDNPLEESGSKRPDQNRLDASSVAYTPFNTQNDPRMLPQRNNYMLQQPGNYRGMMRPYYTDLPASPYHMHQPPFGMGQRYHPELLTNPYLDSFSPPPSLPYRHPSNVPLVPDLVNRDPRISDTAELLADILADPYTYLTNPETCRAISHVLSRYRYTKFIEDFVRAITKSPESLVTVVCTYHGTIVIQNVIRLARRKPVIELVPRCLADYLLELMTDQSGMYAVRMCFVDIEAPKYLPLFEKMMENDNWFTLAMDKSGCRGLNDCIDYMVESLKIRILGRITDRASDLALDIYGNYVLQHVIDLKTSYTKKIVLGLLPHLENLCKVKNGSHLMEKCLQTSCYREIVMKLVDSRKVVRFALHECANYVIQKAIICTQSRDPELYWTLVRILSKEKAALLANRHGRYVAKLLPEHRVEATKMYYQQH